MNVLKTSKEMSPMEIYNLTMNPTTKRMQDFKDSQFDIDTWALYEDVDQKTGEVKQILTIQTTDGEIVGTNSATFKDDFFKVCDLFAQFGTAPKTIKVISGVSKAGREFITCQCIE